MLMAAMDDHIQNGRGAAIAILARNPHEQRRPGQSHAESD